MAERISETFDDVQFGITNLESFQRVTTLLAQVLAGSVLAYFSVFELLNELKEYHKLHQGDTA